MNTTSTIVQGHFSDFSVSWHMSLSPAIEVHEI